jgi:hypothetical protein
VISAYTKLVTHGLFKISRDGGDEH